MIVVDDSGGRNEMQLPVTEGVVNDVLAETGIDLVNAYRADYGGCGGCEEVDGCDEELTLLYAADWMALLAIAVPLTNAEMAWVQAE